MGWCRKLPLAKACLHYPCRTPCLSIRFACPLDPDPGSLIHYLQFWASRRVRSLAYLDWDGNSYTYEILDGLVSRNRSILCHAKNVKEIYYQYEDEIEVPASNETADIPIAAAPVTTTTAVSAPSSGQSQAWRTLHGGHSVSIKAFDILLVIVAQKSKKRVDEIPLSKSIKDLVGGKSTLQNKILGDLQQEFALALEKGEEHPLEELGSALGSSFSGALGNYSTGLISHFIGGKIPGGFNSSAIKSHLSKSWGLGSSHSDGILLLRTTFEPPKWLAAKAEELAWWRCFCLCSVFWHFLGISRCWRRIQRWCRCHHQ